MKPINITIDNFEKEVKLSDKPVLIDFYADWCGPCKMISPIIDSIAEEAQNAKICKINVDEQAELAAQFGVMSIPTLVVVKDGNVVNKAVGLQSKEALLKMLAKA